MFCSISQLHPSKSASNFQNRAHFCDNQKRRVTTLYLFQNYVLFCFLTPSKWICSKLSEQGSFLLDNWKNTLMSLVVCVKYVLNDIFVQINILRCAYLLIFLLCTCLHRNGTCIRMCMHMCTFVGTEILSHKGLYVYTHGCVYPCVYLYISICICEDLDMLNHTWILAWMYTCAWDMCMHWVINNSCSIN